MIFAGLFVALGVTLAPAVSPNQLSLADRCSITQSVLNSTAKQQYGNQMKLRDVTFAERAGERVRRAGHIIVQVEMFWGKDFISFFGSSESCGPGAFMLQHEEPPLVEAKRNPDGNVDKVVYIELQPDHVSPTKLRYKFKERLSLSRHSYCPTGQDGCGWGVCAMRFVGVVEGADNRTWISKVTERPIW